MLTATTPVFDHLDNLTVDNVFNLEDSNFVSISFQLLLKKLTLKIIITLTDVRDMRSSYRGKFSSFFAYWFFMTSHL